MTSPHTALRAAKNELRSLMNSSLSKLSLVSIQEQSTAVFEALIKEKAYINAKNIGVYLSMPDRELQTDSIVRHAFSSGKRVFIPYLLKNQHAAPNFSRVMDMVDLRKLEDYESLSRDKWGIPSLKAEQIEGREMILDDQATATHQRTSLDLILLPGVAFSVDEETGRIRRLGHGKGFYDFFLDRYQRSLELQPNSQSPILCGLALKEQFLQAKPDQLIPVGHQDKLLDSVVVGDGKTKGLPEL